MQVAIIGPRSTVGLAFLRLIQKHRDDEKFQFTLFSQNPQLIANDSQMNRYPIHNSSNLTRIIKHDIIVCLQGSEFSSELFKSLQEKGYSGYFIDTSSALRLESNSTLILDIVNYQQIKYALERNQKIFSGVNCTTSLFAMATQHLFTSDLIQEAFISTYQAASGAGFAMQRQ